MSWTRRRFVTSMAAGAAGVSVGARLRAADAVQERFGEFPLASLVRRFREDQARAAQTNPSAGRARYLDAIDGTARFFALHQDAGGAIIDPFEHAEKQYSTPAFALAGAALCAAARSIRAPRRRGARHGVRLRVARRRQGRRWPRRFLHRAADACRPAAGAARAGDDLQNLAPRPGTHRPGEHLPAPADGGRRANNWNLVAAAGEWMRTKAGLGDAMPWIEASLDRQMDRFTPWGMYRDPNDPLPYDHFARLWALDLLDEGYRGRHAGALEELVERGAWMSLFMQSPWGELPCGGRSAHHQWNEAQQAVTFESWASRFAKRGDPRRPEPASRAALRVQTSMHRWAPAVGRTVDRQEPHGPAATPRLRVCTRFTRSTICSSAAMLAIAWTRADDAIAIAPARRRAAASRSRCSRRSKGVRNAFTRSISKSTRGQTCTTTPPASCAFTMPACRPRSCPMVSRGPRPTNCRRRRPGRWPWGPEWRDRAGAWHALADHGREDLDPSEFVLRSASTRRVELRLAYRGRLRGGAAAVTEHVVLTPERVDIEHRVEGDIEAVRQCWPMLATDGATASVITVAGKTASVTREGRRLGFEARTDGAVASRLDVSEPCRNGLMDACLVQVPARTVRSTIEAPPSAGE